MVTCTRMSKNPKIDDDKCIRRSQSVKILPFN